MLFESTLAALGPPPNRTFDAINHKMTKGKGNGEAATALEGCSAGLYSKNDDLVLLKQPLHEDRLTSFVQRYLAVILIVSYIAILLLESPNSFSPGKETATWCISQSRVLLVLLVS